MASGHVFESPPLFISGRSSGIDLGSAYSSVLDVGEETSPYLSIVIGDYLGRGAFGYVHKGTLHGADIAAKYLLPPTHYMRQGDAEKQFAKEYQILSRLDHPNIVRCYGKAPPFGGNEYGIAMEWMPTDLSQQIPHLSVNRQLKIGVDTSCALTYLHRKGILHRDLTPSNVLLSSATCSDEELTAKLTDLGRATYAAVGSFLRLTATPGALKYMAPETRDGLNSRAYYGNDADVFSLGAVFLAMAINKQPPNVEEREDRVASLELVDRKHPFQVVIASCLEEFERPTAAEVHKNLLGMFQRKQQQQQQHRLLAGRAAHDTPAVSDATRITQLERHLAVYKAELKDAKETATSLRQVYRLQEMQPVAEGGRSARAEEERQSPTGQPAAEARENGTVTLSQSVSPELGGYGMQPRPGFLSSQPLMSCTTGTAKWMPGKQLPGGFRHWSRPEIHDGYLYCVFDCELDQSTIVRRIPTNILTGRKPDVAPQDRWEDVPQAGGRDAYCHGFFKYAKRLHAISTPLQDGIGGTAVYTFRSDLHEWSELFTLNLANFRTVNLTFDVDGHRLVTLITAKEDSYGDDQYLYLLKTFNMLPESQHEEVQVGQLPDRSKILEYGFHDRCRFFNVRILSREGKAYIFNFAPLTKNDVLTTDLVDIPEELSWSETEMVPTPVTNVGACFYEGRLIACGGLTERNDRSPIGDRSHQVAMFLPNSREWTHLPQLAIARCTPHLLSGDGFLLCLAGNHGNTQMEVLSLQEDTARNASSPT